MDAASALLTPQSTRPPAQPQLDGGHVRDIVLVRIASAGKALARSELTADLFPIVSHLVPLAEWQKILDRDLGALADAGLCEAKAVSVAVTEAGAKRAAMMLGVNTLPRTWADARSTRLIAKTLGLDGQPARRLKGLLKADGLRAAIVQHAFKLKIRGLPTAARLREQLAKLALSRAFGNALPPGMDGRSGLSAKDGRSLAGKLATPPREFPTDNRLLTALAMEQAGAAKPDFDSLQTALLRRYVTRGTVAAVSAETKTGRGMKRSAGLRAADRSRVTATPPPPPALPAASPPVGHPAQSPPVLPAHDLRPDFAGFVVTVRTLAQRHAEGWPGNRKAFISRVWTAVKARHPEWAISDLEFKAMLAEAHRTGHIVLANADLKDNSLIADIQASAIAYKNSIFHYVRVDD